METNREQNILLLWLNWHFYEMPKFLFGVWTNYVSFALNYFSLPILIKSIFSPWRRYRWVYPKSFDIAEFFNTLISNIFSRFLGALMRIVLIVVGVIFQLFVILAGIIILLFWVLIPFFIIMGFLFFFFY